MLRWHLLKKDQLGAQQKGKVASTKQIKKLFIFMKNTCCFFRLWLQSYAAHTSF